MQNEGNNNHSAGIAFQVTSSSESTGVHPKASITFRRCASGGGGDLLFVNRITGTAAHYTCDDWKLRINYLGQVCAKCSLYSPTVHATYVHATASGNASGHYMRGTNEVLSGEAWATALYNFNHNDGFLILNRDITTCTARPVFHVGGSNNAGYGGWSAGDSIVTIVRSDGVKTTGSTYSHRGLSLIHI